MTAILQNFVGGSLSFDLTVGGTSMVSPAMESVPVIEAPDTMVVVLDPDGIYGAPEIVLVTDHVFGSATATIVRAQETTLARSHFSGTNWVHSLTAGAIASLGGGTGGGVSGSGVITQAEPPASPADYELWLDTDETEPVSSAVQLLHVRDEKASGTQGGGATSGSWATRVLNTVLTNEISGASLTADEITLPAGTYEVDGSAPAARVNQHKARLYDVTAAAVILYGTNAIAASPEDGDNRSFIRGRFTLTTTSVVRVEHRVETTAATTGFGFGAAALGGNEVYTDLMIRKVA